MPQSTTTDRTTEWTTVERRFEASRSNKDEYMKTVKKLNDYFKGDQWNQAKKFSWQSQPVSNYMADAVQTKVAALVQEVPGTIVEPRSEEHKLTADALKDILQYVYDFNDIPLLLDDFEFSRVLAGTGIWQVAWNPTLLNGLGEIEYKIIDVADFFPDPSAFDLDDCEWVITKTKKSPRYIEERYKVKVDRDVVIGGEDDPYLNQAAAETNKELRVTIYQMLSRGKDGWDITTVGGGKTLRREKGFLRRLPYVVGRYEKLPKCFWGRGLVTPYLGDQDAINAVDQIIVDGSKLASFMQKEVDLDALDGTFDINTFTTQPGLVIPKHGNTPAVTNVQSGTVPGFVRQWRVDKVDEFQRHTGSSEIQRGESPSGRPTGALVQTLLAAGDRKNLRVNRSQYAVLKNVNEITIELAYDNYDTARTFMILGPQNEAQHFDFNSMEHVLLGQDGQPLTDNTGRYIFPEMNVRIVPGIGLPNSGQYRVERAVTAFERKGLPRRKFLEELGFPDAAELDAEMTAKEDEDRQKSVQMQVYQNQLAQDMKAQSEAQMPKGEEQGEPQEGALDAVLAKLNAFSPEELQAILSQPPEEQIRDIMGLADEPITPEQAKAIIDSRGQ